MRGMSVFAKRCQPCHLPAGGWRAVLLRDPCVYCGSDATTIEHITPKHLGGTLDWRNIAPACQRCNGGRGHAPLLLWLLGVKFGPAPLGRFGRKKARKERERLLRAHLLEEAKAMNGWNAQAQVAKAREKEKRDDVKV